MTAEVIPFPSKVVYSAESFEAVSRRADIALIDAFCEYADQLADVVTAGPLHPKDRLKLIHMIGIIAHDEISPQ
jgi:hypothetical protein